jgi:hypothetical protein
VFTLFADLDAENLPQDLLHRRGRLHLPSSSTTPMLVDAGGQVHPHTPVDELLRAMTGCHALAVSLAALEGGEKQKMAKVYGLYTRLRDARLDDGVRDQLLAGLKQVGATADEVFFMKKIFYLI